MVGWRLDDKARELFRYFSDSNLNSTEELCKIIKASILNPSGQVIQLIKVKFIRDLLQDTKNLFSRLYSNKETFMAHNLCAQNDMKIMTVTRFDPWHA